MFPICLQQLIWSGLGDRPAITVLTAICAFSVIGATGNGRILVLGPLEPFVPSPCHLLGSFVVSILPHSANDRSFKARISRQLVIYPPG